MPPATTTSKIAVDVDYSAGAQCALDHALVLARRTGASLALIHVASVPNAIGAGSDGPWAALQQERLAADRASLEAVAGDRRWRAGHHARRRRARARRAPGGGGHARGAR